MGAGTNDSPGEPAHRSLRVLMTADAAGGVWQYCLDLVAGLVQKDAEILVATLGPRPSPEQKKQILAFSRVTLAEGDYALEWMPDPWRDVEASGKWLLQLQSEFQADVIHLNGYAHASLPWRKPVLVTAHSCVYSWWRAVHACAPGEEWAEYKRRVIAGLEASDLATAPSHYMADGIQSEYGIHREKIRIIHNFSRASRSSTKEKQPFLLAAGRMWDPAKNLALLAKLAPKLDWEIRVAGNDPSPPPSEPHRGSIRSLGILSHRELLRQMSRCSIFLHPALYEPFGLAVLEAARARCCLVLSDIPSLRELWDDAAIFIHPHDSDRWIFELNRLSNDSTARQALGNRAYRHARKYRAGAAIGKYWNLYQALLRSKDSAKKGVAA